jgi:hypothetical protein
MGNELLVLVNEPAMDAYKGAIADLKSSYTKWGFNLDEKFSTLTFRGDLRIFKKLEEFHMEYFDEKQALGKIFLYIVRDSLDQKLRNELSKLPIFDCGFWSVYDIPAYILMVHKNSQANDALLRRHGAKKIFGFSYFIPKDFLDVISLESPYEMTKFSVLKCYPIGNSVSIEVWKDSFYKSHLNC